MTVGNAYGRSLLILEIKRCSVESLAFIAHGYALLLCDCHYGFMRRLVLEDLSVCLTVLV